MKSTALLHDLQELYPDRITNDVLSSPLYKFFIESAKAGFVDGLKLIPNNSRILKSEFLVVGCQTLLHLAVKSCRPDAVKLLLDRGADVDPRIEIAEANSQNADTAEVAVALDNIVPDALNVDGVEVDAGDEDSEEDENANDEESEGEDEDEDDEGDVDDDAAPFDYSEWQSTEQASPPAFPLLHQAVQLDDHRALKLLVDFGADIAAVSGPDESRALHLASQYGFCECIRILLEAGETVDVVDCNGFTPLFYACKEHKVEAARELISRGADVCKEKTDASLVPLNSMDNSGTSPLYCALKRRSISAALVILEAGANPNIRCTGMRTALHVLAEHCSKCGTGGLVLKLMIDLGVDVNAVDENGVTPLHLTAAEGDRNSMGFIHTLLKAGAEPARRWTPSILKAVPRFIAPWSNSKLKRPLNANLRNGEGRTALHILACECEWSLDLELVLGLMLGKGVDLNERDAIGRTALHFSTVYNKELLSWLLEQGDVDTEPKTNLRYADIPTRLGRQMSPAGGQTAESITMQTGSRATSASTTDSPRPVIAEFWTMLKSGNLNTRTVRALLAMIPEHELEKDGVTPMQWACQENRVDVVKILLDYGADVQREINGKLPIQIATSVAVWQVLANKMQPAPTSVWDAASKGDELGVRLAIGAGKNNRKILNETRRLKLNAGGLEVRAGPLHVAAFVGSLDVVELLLRCGVPVNARSLPDRLTPLHISAIQGHDHVCRFLLEKGATTYVNSRTSQGRTPLLYTAEFNHFEAACALLAYGATVDEPDRASITPLHHAARNGSFKDPSAPTLPKMTIDNISDKPVTLYTAGTSNGWKISIALEDLGLPYTVRPVSLATNEQKEEWFLKINPNGRIPAIVDHTNGDFPVFESGAILLYLAEHHDPEHKLLPKDPKQRSEAIQWLMWQISGLGPMQGQLGHFNVWAPEKIPYAINRYLQETLRLYSVLERRLSDGRLFLAGGDRPSVADYASVGWVLRGEKVGANYDETPLLRAWFKRLLEREAVRKGISVPSRPEALDEWVVKYDIKE
ncbi:hypothetical protein HDU96_001982 [Phlyctochytrium bullatum]|nr:hypothetical protein HDU96_001982 [Phlyctochytrium bullatum]